MTQFHFLQWPDGGCPNSATPVVELVNDLQRVQRQSGNRPITVHCSDGVSRTGAFCALVTALERVKTEQIVDVFRTVRTHRIQRSGMVANLVSGQGLSRVGCYWHCCRLPVTLCTPHIVLVCCLYLNLPICGPLTDTLALAPPPPPWSYRVSTSSSTRLSWNTWCLLTTTPTSSSVQVIRTLTELLYVHFEHTSSLNHTLLNTAQPATRIDCNHCVLWCGVDVHVIGMHYTREV